MDASQDITLPEGIYLTIHGGRVAALTPDGEVLDWTLSSKATPLPLNGHIPIITIMGARCSKLLDLKHLPPFDILELFAFICPAQFASPTVKGLCNALDIAPPDALEDYPLALIEIMTELFATLRSYPEKERQQILEIATAMGRQGEGWAWTPFIFSALGETYDPRIPVTPKDVMAIWKDLPEWAEDAPKPDGAHHNISDEEAISELADILSVKQNKGRVTEIRSSQQDYTKLFTQLFTPRDAEGDLNFIAAEAGTGIGKTLGYLAPTKAWTEKNDQVVWVSTYTKNLQRQMDQEMDALYPDQAERDRKTLIRKGRENYLCLLNLEELIGSAALARSPQSLISAGLMARWASKTKNGDVTGNDFPGWMSLLTGYQNSYGLTDKRGECIYSACDHYKKCFIEHTVRKTKHANIVVANHALVMIQSVLASMDDDMPTRIIFDEGHHLFDAADSAFSAHLTGQEMAELRRWILGPETQSKGRRSGRAKGLQKRLEDLISDNEDASDLLQKILRNGHALVAPGWLKRLQDGAPSGPAEEFLSALQKQVIARQQNPNAQYYSIETEIFPLAEDIIPYAVKLKTALSSIATPMKALARHFISVMDENASLMEKDTRRRMDAAVKGLMRRGDMTLNSWMSMLDLLIDNRAPANSTPSLTDHVDWFELSRQDGRMVDIGMFRHFIDPMKPFSDYLHPHLHGLAITSATLKANSNITNHQNDIKGDQEGDHWAFADLRMGSSYLNEHNTPQRLSLSSPYDYQAQTKIIVVQDINKNDGDAVSTAFRELFLAANGGGLGVFTSIQRLKYVQDKILAPLTDAHISLYSQHVDDMDIGTLIDMFREDEHSCLLGTDAVRDGVDVPGDALRLLIFDRVPWPRPSILHRQRKSAFGQIMGSPRSFDEALTRLKLKQAYGRLIRSQSDKGVFVMLDSALPSRLHDAFPPDVLVQKLSLSESCHAIREFLSEAQKSDAA